MAEPQFPIRSRQQGWSPAVRLHQRTLLMMTRPLTADSSDRDDDATAGSVYLMVEQEAWPLPGSVSEQGVARSAQNLALVAWDDLHRSTLTRQSQLYRLGSSRRGRESQAVAAVAPDLNPEIVIVPMHGM